MLKSSNIYFKLKSSTLVSDLYGLIWRTLYLIFKEPNVKYTVRLEILYYQKWVLIWRFIFVRSVISKNDFISNFIIVVNSIYIFEYIIFIDLCLLLMTYIANPLYVLLGESHHVQISIVLEYILFT